eukprot:CAMPEP_0197893358 /NCGR_PEP_ID=MMETSP1439-20131203/32717_1 /TAXON_ID=66791 /ORGANISM="Gonyaulax spinifera, Strain CCMP409" /LENGTH=129 /DNA_ID=CAMNT_0043513623 /DNA_START=24 /DNA_END=410 /DNA_ORIENTATION=+
MAAALLETEALQTAQHAPRLSPWNAVAERAPQLDRVGLVVVRRRAVDGLIPEELRVLGLVPVGRDAERKRHANAEDSDPSTQGNVQRCGVVGLSVCLRGFVMESNSHAARQGYHQLRRALPGTGKVPGE